MCIYLFLKTYDNYLGTVFFYLNLSNIKKNVDCILIFFLLYMYRISLKARKLWKTGKIVLLEFRTALRMTITLYLQWHALSK